MQSHTSTRLIQLHSLALFAEFRCSLLPPHHIPFMISFLLMSPSFLISPPCLPSRRWLSPLQLDQPHALYLSSQFQHQEGMCGKSTVYVMFRSWDWLPSNKLNVGTRHGPLGETIPHGGKLQWTDGDETRHRVSQLPSPSPLVGTKFTAHSFCVNLQLRRQTNGFMIVELVIVNDFRQVMFVCLPVCWCLSKQLCSYFQSSISDTVQTSPEQFRGHLKWPTLWTM